MPHIGIFRIISLMPSLNTNPRTLFEIRGLTNIFMTSPLEKRFDVVLIY